MPRIATVVLAATLTLLACRARPGPDSGTAPGDAPSDATFRVALLLPGPIDDRGWNQAAYEALALMERELGARTAHTARVAPKDFERVLAEYADRGFELVIGHGGEFIPAMELVAARFPATKFAVVARYPGNNRNLGAVSFRDGEIGYLTGTVAALKTRTKRVAYIGGAPYAHMREQAILFERGARATDADVEVSIVWLDSWSDAAKARQVARDHLARGFDVLAANADEAGLAVIDEARRAGAWAIGFNLDQWEVAPGTVVTSGVQRVALQLLAAARLVEAGRWEGKQYEFGLRDGVQSLAPFRGLLTPTQAARVAATERDILAGRIDVVP